MGVFPNWDIVPNFLVCFSDASLMGFDTIEIYLLVFGPFMRKTLCLPKMYNVYLRTWSCKMPYIVLVNSDGWFNKHKICAKVRKIKQSQVLLFSFSSLWNPTGSETR